VTHLGSKIYNYKFIYSEKSETCVAGLLNIGSNIAKAKKPNVKNDLNTSQNKALKIAG
jgi:hypothetical protein